jgi:hypothetical protein
MSLTKKWMVILFHPLLQKEMWGRAWEDIRNKRSRIRSGISNTHWEDVRPAVETVYQQLRGSEPPKPYKTGKQLLAEAGLTKAEWESMSKYQKLVTMNSSPAFKADWVYAGLIDMGVHYNAKTRGEYYSKADARDNARKRVDKYFREDFHYEARIADADGPNIPLWQTYGKKPRTGERTEPPTPLPTPVPSDLNDEEVQWVLDLAELRDTNNQMPEQMEVDNPRARSRAIMGKFQGTRTKTRVFTRRQASKNASRGAAIRNFWNSRLPLLTMRTFMAAPFQITASTPNQGVWSESSDDYIFPNKAWCYNLLSKMQADMAVPSGNTPGDGVVQSSTEYLSIDARNNLRQGLSLLNQTRSYTFMNTVNAVAFLECYEYVWKGMSNDHPMTTNPIGDRKPDQYTPQSLWRKDVLTGDNPVFGTSLPNIMTGSGADVNISELAPGQRPNRYSKLLNQYWRLEKKTKYILAAGNTCTHTVNLPSMYISPAEITPVTGDQYDVYDYIPGKTRCLMFIVHGQLGFEGHNSDAYGSLIEYVPAAISCRWRQITKCRIQEHGQKTHVMWTGPHNLISATNATEHRPLVSPVLLVIDPENVAKIADRDQTATTEGTDPGPASNA